MKKLTLNGILYAYYEINVSDYEENIVFINVQNTLPGRSESENENFLVEIICLIENSECKLFSYLNLKVPMPEPVQNPDKLDILRVKNFPEFFLLHDVVQDDKTETIYFRKDRFAGMVKKFISDKGYVLLDTKKEDLITH